MFSNEHRSIYWSHTQSLAGIVVSHADMKGVDCPGLSSEQLACKYIEGRGKRDSAVGLSEGRAKGLGTPKRTGPWEFHIRGCRTWRL